MDKQVPNIYLSPPTFYRDKYRYDVVVEHENGTIERVVYGYLPTRDVTEQVFQALRDLYTVVETNGKSKVSYIPGRCEGLAPDLLAEIKRGYEDLKRPCGEKPFQVFGIELIPVRVEEYDGEILNFRCVWREDVFGSLDEAVEKLSNSR